MHQNYFNMLLGSPAIIRTYVQVPPSPLPPLACGVAFTGVVSALHFASRSARRQE